MKGEKHEKLAELETKLKDYIGDVESIQDPLNIFQNDKKVIIVACSQSDYDSISKNKKDDEFIVIKANPLCEVYT
jgi:PHD/YefM family antitoxin component YafN of YafNO toxin-antitoxin module